MWPAEFWVSLSAWLALASSTSCHMLTYNLTLTVTCTFANQDYRRRGPGNTRSALPPAWCKPVVHSSQVYFSMPARPASPSWHPWTFTSVQTEDATIPAQENFTALKVRKVFSCSPWEFKTIAQDLGVPQGLQAIPLVALQTEAVSCPGETPRTKFRLYTPKTMKSIDPGWKGLHILELLKDIVAPPSGSTNSFKSSTTKVPGNQVSFLLTKNSMKLLLSFLRQTVSTRPLLRKEHNLRRGRVSADSSIPLGA